MSDMNSADTNIADKNRNIAHEGMGFTVKQRRKGIVAQVQIH